MTGVTLGARLVADLVSEGTVAGIKDSSDELAYLKWFIKVPDLASYTRTGGLADISMRHAMPLVSAHSGLAFHRMSITHLHKRSEIRSDHRVAQGH